MFNRVFQLFKIARKLSTSGAVDTISEIYTLPFIIRFFFDSLSIGSSKKLINDQRIMDFRIICSHQESLHSHDAISVLLPPESDFSSDIPHEFWSSMIHVS